MATDVNVIELALEGLDERDLQMAWWMYRAARGVPPPAKPEGAKGPPTHAAIRNWVRQHNEAFARGRTPAEARAKAVAKAKSSQTPSD